MDEDEREMLSEARARLANTKGKKAKRKAREKQLEEARRLASLQKRRELKAAGIQTVKRAKRVRGMDYNAEIPFEIKPVPGPYSTDMEFREHLHQSNVSFAPSSLTEYEKPHKKDLEDQLMKEDVRQQRSQDRKTTPSAVQQLRALVVSNTGKHKRKLELPPPNVHVSGLENLINLDRPESRFMGGKNSLVDALVSLHHEVPAQCTSNSISASVSVEGQLDSTSLKHSGRPTVPDKIPIYDTARTELECFHSENAFSETPIRDTLQINNVDVLQDEPVFKTRDRMLYDQLSDRLTSLPAPNNDYHVVVPDILKGGKHSSKLAEIGTSTSADLAPNTTRKSLHTTETTHRCLPKISIGYMGDFISRADVKSTKASALIATELADIVRHDTDHGNYDLESKFTKYDEIPGFGGAEIAAASELIFREATSFGALLKGEKEMECSHLHASCARTADSDDVNRIIHLASGKFFDGVSAFIAEHNRIEGFMLSDSRLAAKLESKVGRLIAGHVKRTGKLNEKLKATCSLLAVAKEEYLSYMQLETHEVKICTDRVYMLSKFKALVEIREGELQLQFRALLQNA